MLNIDHAERIVGQSKYRELIAAVLGASDADELWVEWKSTFDLQTKESQFAIARAILGFANRMPDDAQAYAQGYAYLVVGAEPGQLQGVVELDIAKLSPGIERYCGPVAAGPRYRYTYVPYDFGEGEKQVLVVEIDPPRWGDTIHTLRTEFDRDQAGTVFVRRPGQTQRPNAHETQLLVDRARRQSIRLAVTPSGGLPLRPVKVSKEDVDAWLAQEDAAVRQAGLPAPRPAPAPAPTKDFRIAPELLGLQAGFAAVAAGLGDPRTADEYKAEADAYRSDLRKAFPFILKDRAARRLHPLRLQLVNETTQNLTSLQVVVELPKGLLVAEELSAYKRDTLPTRPVPYGQKNNFGLPAGFRIPALKPTVPANFGPWLRSIEQGTEVTFPGIDLRPRQRVELDPLVLLVAETTTSPIHATWSATAKNVDAVVEGTLTLPVEGEAWTLQQVLGPLPGRPSS